MAPHVMPAIELDANDIKTKLGGWARGFGAIHRQLMRDAAQYWHDEIFPSHFTPGNETRYTMAARTPGYMSRKRKYGIGQGRYVSNIFTGTSLRWMMHSEKITATAAAGTSQATLRMSAPTYFTNPFVGTKIGRHGKEVTITRQPDKVAEVTQVNDRDDQQLRRFMQRRYDQLVREAFSRARLSSESTTPTGNVPATVSV